MVAREVDRVGSGKLRVDLLAGLTELQGFKASIILRKFLLDYIGLNGYPNVVCLSREVCAHVVVHAVLFKGWISQVAPQHSAHPKFVGAFECGGHLLDLAGGFRGAKVDSSTDRRCAEIPSLLNRSEHNLVEFIWVGEKLVVV